MKGCGGKRMQFFVECLFHFNDFKEHESYNKFEADAKAFSLKVVPCAVLQLIDPGRVRKTPRSGRICMRSFWKTARIWTSCRFRSESARLARRLLLPW